MDVARRVAWRASGETTTQTRATRTGLSQQRTRDCSSASTSCTSASLPKAAALPPRLCAAQTAAKVAV
eukprot:4223152-Pleurochrysis_carterae.AAC.4